MSVGSRGRARRVEAAPLVGGGGDPPPDYASAFAVPVGDPAARSAERWAGSTLEDAPRLLRWFVVVGWKLVLRLRLAPAAAPDAIAGWTIVRSTRDSVTLEVRSSLVTARKVMDVDDHLVTLATYVWFKRPAGRLLWSAIAPVHHVVEPLLLTLAVRRIVERGHPPTP